MDSATYPIAGGDFEHGGSASKRLKEMLKRLGADPKAVRRTMIAAYEAEMNVVIHALKGVMKVAVDPEQVEVAVIDEGPGIADIELAMKEGYSTAPAAARALGFGAGMGLPNIRHNSDLFSIQSEVGQGTRVRFSILLRRAAAMARAANSLVIRPERCRQCRVCLHACPTGALRVRGGRPALLDHLCIDCTACIDTCMMDALDMPGRGDIPAVGEESTLVLPNAFLAQFGPTVTAYEVVDALRGLGFGDIRLMEGWQASLRDAVLRHARDEARAKPVLSPVCPAVVNLIQVRFPSLLDHVAPFVTPFEAAREELTAAHAVFAGVCPAQHTILRAPNVLTRVDVVAPMVLRNAVLPRVRAGKTVTRDTEGRRPESGMVQVSGIQHVMSVLDQVENGLMYDYTVLELYACDQGCFGSPVWTEDAFIARQRYERAREVGRLLPYDDLFLRRGGAVRRTTPLEARRGLRLDDDMAVAIRKLSELDRLARQLPGHNCGMCGAPTCSALAEDAVLGRGCLDECMFLGEARSELAVHEEDSR